MTTDLAKFDEVRAEIAKYKEMNENLVFNYEDPTGNKEARSHIFKLRRTKATIGDVHKAAKAEALAVCQAIDKEKRVLIADVEEMIEVHAAPVREIENREITEAKAKAESERLEKERIEQERLEAIKKQEEEVARKAVELKAKEESIVREREKLEAEKRAEAEAKRRETEARKHAEQEKQEAIERMEREKKEALGRAEREKQEAVEAEKERARKEAEAEKVEEERLAEIERKRIENKKHRQEIEARIHKQIDKIISDSDVTKKVVGALRDGRIPNVTINY